MSSEVNVTHIDEKKGKEKAKHGASSSARPSDAQPRDVGEDIDATMSDAVEGSESSSSEQVDPSISRLIKKTASAVGRECEARWEKKVININESEAAKTSRRFQEKRRTTDAQLQALEERLRAEI